MALLAKGALQRKTFLAQDQRMVGPLVPLPLLESAAVAVRMAVHTVVQTVWAAAERKTFFSRCDA